MMRTIWWGFAFTFAACTSAPPTVDGTWTGAASETSPQGCVGLEWSITLVEDAQGVIKGSGTVTNNNVNVVAVSGARTRTTLALTATDAASGLGGGDAFGFTGDLVDDEAANGDVIESVAQCRFTLTLTRQ